eukprot:Transcript_28504.p1 GENE.Transcript_28504~~Transcript_28504.p1  ORF type:complete len:91 (-),score=6.86 Transcript_28504:86-358(-)
MSSGSGVLVSHGQRSLPSSMASLSSCAGGQDASATELDANLKAAAFPELQRKCTELKIDFEPSIDSELAHIERRRLTGLGTRLRRALCKS